MVKEKKKISDISTYDMDDSSNNSYLEDSYDFSEGGEGEQGLNDDEEDLYVDDAAAEKRRKQERAKVRARKKQAQQAPAVGGLEALFAQEAPPPRIKSIGIHGEQELAPVPRTKPTAPLRSRSGGLLKLNRKVSRAVTDAGRGVVEVAASVTRGREEGETFGERVRSSSLGALSRKLTSRAERKQAKEAADGEGGGEGGMGDLSLDDGPTDRGNHTKRIRGSSIGALARRGPRRNRWKSVDDAEDLEGELDLNAGDRSKSPVRGRQRGGSLGPISTKARRERWKSVDDKEDLLDADGEFELKLGDSESTPKMKERNSIGAINTRVKREDRKKQDSSGEMRVGRKVTRSTSRDKTADLNKDGEKKPKRRGRRATSKDANLTDDSSGDEGEKKTKRKLKKSNSKSSTLSDDSSDHDKKPKRRGKRSTSKDANLSDDDSSDEGGKVRRRKNSTDKPRKKASRSPKQLKKKTSKKVDDEPSDAAGSSVELDAGQTRGRGRVARRVSSSGDMQQTADEVLRRTHAANQRWVASNQEESVIERRVRRRASVGAGERMRGDT